MRIELPLDRRSLELAPLVVPRDFADYLESRGWTLTGKETQFADIYQSPNGGKVRLAIPNTNQIDDYALATAMAIGWVAHFEGRAAYKLLDELVARRQATPLRA